MFIEAAARMNHRRDVKFALIGDGPYLPDLQIMAESRRATNLMFLPLQPRALLAAQLGAADALAITQRKTVNDCVFPGKLLYYMSAGRPILAAVSDNSETGRFITEHDVGIVTSPEDPDALVEGINFLQKDPERSDQMGRNGRALAERMFDRKLVLSRFSEVLRQLAG